MRIFAAVVRPLTIITLLLAATGYGGLYALEVRATEWELGVRWIGNWEEELTDSSGNLLLSSFSFRLPIAFSQESDFSLVPALSLYTMRYRWDESSERTVMSDIEWRELTAVVPLLDATVRWDFFSTDTTRLAAEAGLGLELPVPVKSWGGGENTSKILSGYYGRGKLVLPTAALMGYWPMTNAFDVSTRLGLHFPVHHFWDGEGAPFYDHLMVSLSAGIRLPLRERSVVEQPQPPTPEGAPPLPDS